MWNRQRDEPDRNESSPRFTGVVDSIGIGFETLVARPQLVLPPVLLDLYLWLGVHITSRPLLVQIGDWLRHDLGAPRELATEVEGRGLANVQELAALWLPTVRVPSFVSMLSSETPYRLENWRPAVTLPWWGIMAAAVVFLVAGLLIGSEYLMSLAGAASARESGLLARTRETMSGSLRLAGWIGLITGVLLLVTWPILLGAFTFAVLGAGVSIWFFLALFLPISWGFVFFFFSIQAMFVDRVGPLAALRSSYLVVRSDFWRSLGLIVAYFIVVTGFPQVWRLLISQPAGLVIGIVGHAVIGTGMILATMVFYQDRARHLNIAGRI